jgi:hypothetical protein
MSNLHALARSRCYTRPAPPSGKNPGYALNVSCLQFHEIYLLLNRLRTFAVYYGSQIQQTSWLKARIRAI